MSRVLTSPRAALASAASLLVLRAVPLELGMQKAHDVMSVLAVVAISLIPLNCLRACRLSPTSSNRAASWLAGLGCVVLMGYVVMGQRQDEFDASIGTWAAAPIAVVAVLVGAFVSEPRRHHTAR
jgi:hypothetical protein